MHRASPMNRGPSTRCWSNPCFELWPLLHFRYTSAPMSAAECQRALAQAMSKDLGIEYRKNLGGLFEAVTINGARHFSVLGARYAP